MKETTEAGIVPTLSFVIGFPEEGRQDLDETLKLALKSASTGNANILVQMATILPGTDLYEKYRHRLIREVDTYFSLGIEFDNGDRIASDDALIDSAPAIFSSFYNLPCPAGTLKELNEIASYFTIIAALYPRTFFLLSLELDLPVVDLFFAFLNRVAEIEGEISPGFTGPAPSCPDLPFTGTKPPQQSLHSAMRAVPPPQRRLTPQSCLACFTGFAEDCLARHGSLVREYLPEILKYETCLLRAATDESPPSSFHVDPGSIGDLKPLRNEKISDRAVHFRSSQSYCGNQVRPFPGQLPAKGGLSSSSPRRRAAPRFEK